MSADFFNQQFSPLKQNGTSSAATSSSHARPPPPPPPSSGNAPSSGNLRPRKTGTSQFSSAPKSGGSIGGVGSTKSDMPTGRTAYYATKSSNGMAPPPARPTGNYYPSGPINESNSSSNTASFYNMSGTTNTSSTTSSDQGWYGSSSSSNPYGAPDPYATSDNSVVKESNVFNSTSMPTPGQQQQEQPKRSESLEYLSSTAPSNDVTSTLQGTMSTMNPSPSINIMQPSTSTTSMNSTTTSYSTGAGYNPTDFENEPPLLEELGINLDQIRAKSLAVILPLPTRLAQKYNIQNDITTMMEDADLIGPIIYALCLGMELLLVGKIHFESIYGLTLFGVVSMTLILNLMSPTDSISLWTVVSVLGYSLLPVNLLAGINIVVSVQKMGTVGWILAWMTILWCTISSTRLFEKGCGLRDQRYLVGYPNALLYSAFVMLTIF